MPRSLFHRAGMVPRLGEEEGEASTVPPSGDCGHGGSSLRQPTEEQAGPTLQPLPQQSLEPPCALLAPSDLLQQQAQGPRPTVLPGSLPSRRPQWHHSYLQGGPQTQGPKMEMQLLGLQPPPARLGVGGHGRG